MADAAVKAVGFIKRALPNGSRQGGMARFARQKPLSAIRFVQWSHHSWPDSPGEAVERGRVCPAGSVERGKIRSSCMILGIRTAKGRLDGKIPARCIPKRRFAGHFEYMGSISCQNQLISNAWRRYLAAKGHFSCPGLLWECIRAKFCQECGFSCD